MAHYYLNQTVLSRYRVAKPAAWREPTAATVVDGYLKPAEFRLPPEPKAVQ